MQSQSVQLETRSESGCSGVSDAVDKEVKSLPEEEVVEEIRSPCPRTRTVYEGLCSLETVLLDDIFQPRASLMQTVSKCFPCRLFGVR